MILYILIGVIIALLTAVIILAIRYSYRVVENTEQIRKNDNLAQQGQVLQQKNEELQHEKEKIEQFLSGIKSSIEAQQNVLKSLTATEETMRAAATKRAEEEYQSKFDALAATYEQKELEYKTKYDQAITLLNRSLLAEKGKLEDLEAKQQAYFEAQKRAQEIEEQKDYYRLVLSDYDVSDIHLLRDLQTKFARKDVIDKMIWETYYRPAFDALTGRLFPIEKVCGIYKITCLDNQQAYIGQSVDIKERFRQHIKSGLSHTIATNKLYQEMYKRGPENFTFEILEQVPREKLNERETYWIDFYKTKEIGLNITRGGA